jgi:NCS1 family nucleobase:cation symporter-1
MNSEVGGQPDDHALSVERRSIDPVPDSERHGTARGLFPVWFGANQQLTAVVTGALAPAVGLSLPWGVTAIVVGNLFGAIFMALHSAQGPKLGIPQMIQSRAQFGLFGAILPILLVILMYVGFFASSGVLGGDALAHATHIGPVTGIVITAVLCVVITVYGYRLIHHVERVSSALSTLAFVCLTVVLFTSHDLSVLWHFGKFTPGTFLLVVTIAGTWQLSYCPYVADYSRYLPRKTSVAASYWWTYAGSNAASIWMMAFGALVVGIAPTAFDNGSTSFVIDLAPSGIRAVVGLVLALGVIAVNVLNLYGAFMSVVTTATAIKPFAVTRAVRGLLVTGIGVLGTVLALVGRTSFLSSYESFILFLTYFLVPWTAINLVDFYLVRRERYDIAAIFDKHGRYGLVSWRALGVYAAGVIVEVPFISTSIYTGPMVAKLAGADISWILGLIVSSVGYYLVMRQVSEPEPAALADV